MISVSGADKLKTGVNKVQIVVQAENGVKKTYTIQVTRGAAQQESQDTQQKGETQAPADGQQYFTIDETNLYLTDSIPDRYVLDGFVKDTVTLWENQYPCMRKDGIDTPLRLLYLVDENGQNGALYMLDLDDPEEIYPFVCMNYNQYKHTIGEETTSAEASTQEGETGLFQSTESQMRLILCAFVVVVLILLIIIVVLIVKRKKDDDDPYDDFYDDDDDDDEDYDDPDDEKLYETDDPDDTGISKRYGKETFRKKGGFMQQRAQSVLAKTVSLLEEIERNTLFVSLSRGVFADIKRPPDGGKGLDGVVAKEDDYFNPFIEIFLKNKTADKEEAK